MKRILIIGGTGYIGSLLRIHLSQVSGIDTFWNSVPEYAIDTVDLEWFGAQKTNLCMDYRYLTKDQVQKYDVVILLAGFSSPAQCIASGFEATYTNNVTNFVSLVSKLREGQKFIYMSSASVYNGLQGFSKETDTLPAPKNVYDLAKQEIDRIIVLHPHIEYYGLRLATVNGYAPVLRTDIMINAMVNEANTMDRVVAFNKDIRKGILDIRDLCYVIEKIIEGDDHRGIYNLASFHGTVGEIAARVSELMNVTLITKEDERTSLTYDFQMDCSKLCDTYRFTMKGSIDSIVSELKHAIKLASTGKRINNMNYV